LILAGALLQTLVGELTVLPDSGFKGLLLRGRRRGKGRSGEGSPPPPLQIPGSATVWW